MSSTVLQVASAWAPNASSRIRVSVRRHDELPALNGYATLSIGSGAADLQTYLTRADLEELESMLALARKELRDLQTVEVTA